jgi:AAA domain
LKPIDPNRLALRQALEKDERYIVSPIFPCGAMHLITGDSGIGKTTWFLEWLHDWSLGKCVIGGLTSHPCEWVYVTMDRSLRDTNRTLRRIGLADWNIPVYPIEEICSRNEVDETLEAPTIFQIHRRFPNAQLICLEGLQTITPNTGRGQTQNKAEALWILEIRDKILNKGITVIASEHQGKGSDGTGTSQRKRALGSATMLGGIGTTVSFDYPREAKDKKETHYVNERIVYIEGPNFAPYTLQYDKDENGRLILNTSRSGVELFTHVTDEDHEIQIEAQFSHHPINQLIRTGVELTAWGKVSSMTENQLYKWVKKTVSSGRMEMIKRGEYRKVQVQ